MELVKLYKKFFQKIVPLSKMKGLQWFALERNYGDYGDFTVAYNVIKDPKLIDLGNMKIRQSIIADLEKRGVIDASYILDPDEQYSGGDGNKRAHRMLRKYYGDKFEGTIIVEKYVDDEELEGPTEVVLWRDYDNLLEKATS